MHEGCSDLQPNKWLAAIKATLVMLGGIGIVTCFVRFVTVDKVLASLPYVEAFLIAIVTVGGLIWLWKVLYKKFLY